MNINDRELLARTLQAEAGNQGYGGMLAAGSVIMNRANTSGYGNGLRGVILKPGQFSAWNSMTGYAGGEQGQDMAGMRASDEAYKAADALISGAYDDVTGGATHYYNPAISQPKWGQKSGGDWKQIGDHVFGFADAGKKSNSNQAIASDTMRVLGEQPKGLLEVAQATDDTESKMIPEEQPKGLLGSLGIQKMVEGAEGEAGQRFYQRDTFKDTAARMAPLLASMGSSPALQKATAGIAAQRTEGRARNKTIEYLRNNGREDLASAVESGALSANAAASELFKKDAATKGVVVDKKLINPVTGEVIYQGEEPQGGDLTKDKLAGLNSLRDDLRSELKPFEIVKSGYNNITTFYNNPSATSDYALAVAFAKILDPGSVAREGEVAAVQNAGARIPALGQALKNAVTGEGQLTQEVRQQIAELATKVYSERQTEAKKTIFHYEEMAARAGLPPEFIYSGSIPDARSVVPAVVPANAVGQGITQSMWDGSTDEEKKAWLE